MQTLRLILAVLVSAVAATAQTVYVSPAGSPVSAGTIYRDNTSNIGQKFTTDSSAASFTLNSISIDLTSANGINDFTVRIMTDSGSNTPGSLVGTLSGPISPSGSSTFNFTTSGINLTAGTSYWLTMGFTSGAGDFGFGLTSTAATGPWTLGGIATTFAGSWNNAGGNNAIVSITATAVPEPSTYAVLTGLAALGLVVLRRKRA